MVLGVISFRGCDGTFKCICILHRNQRRTCQWSSAEAGLQRGASSQAFLPRDVTITAERSAHSTLSNDPSQTALRAEGCRGYIKDGRYAFTL